MSMKKIIPFIWVLLLLKTVEAEVNSIHIIGLDIDRSEYAKGSYTVMYDSKGGKKTSKKYVSYRTIGVYRKGEKVKVFSLDFLLVPTVKGFKYVTQSTIEEKMKSYVRATKEDDYDRSFEKEYSLETSLSEPKFFNSKKAIEKFMKAHHPSFEDAISIKYEKISFIRPNFYITKGFESEVHGGATWFNATEISRLYPLSKKMKPFSNNLTKYLPRKQVNDIIKKIASDKKYIDEKCSDKTVLPWGSSIEEHKEVYFTFSYLFNQIYLQPLVLLNGNSARSFLAKGEPKLYKDVNKKLDIKWTPLEARLLLNRYGFISPDNHTQVTIDNGKIEVVDMNSNKILYQGKFPKFRKIIMSEWALGSYAQDWRDRFTVKSNAKSTY